jgi:hypothetical protein
MATIRNKATLDSKPFSSGVDQMKAKVGGFSKSLKSMKGAVAGAFAVGALVKWANSSMNAADEIDNLTKQTGLNVEEVQALKIAAEEAGIGFETLRPTINQFRRALDQAMSGNQSMIKSLKTMGIQMDDIAGLTVGQSLDLVTSKMYEGRDSAEVMAESVKLLGSESTRVQAILFELGEVGIGGLIDKYKEYMMAVEAVNAADRQQEIVERTNRRILSRSANLFAKGVGTWELLLRGGGRKLDEEIFGNPEKQARLAKDANDKRREYMRAAAEARAKMEIDQINEQRRIAAMREEEQQKYYKDKLDELNAELAIAKTAQERLEIIKEIAKIEGKIKEDKIEAIEAEKQEGKFSDLRRIGANLITPESLGRFGELDPRANLSKDRVARIYEIYGKIQTEQGKKMMRYMQDIADNTSNNQAVL